MDQLDSMRVFIAVAETGGFAPAARQLQRSPAAVTRAVAALEQRLGARLLQRTTRQMRLTEAGQRFLADGKRILGELLEAEASVRGDHAEPQGVLAVTAPVIFGRMRLAPVLLEFLQQHPKVRARAMFVDRIVNLMDEGFDVAVRIASLPDSSLTAIRVGEVRRVTVASPGYLEQHGTPGTPADIEQHRAIGVWRGAGEELPWTYANDTVKDRRPRVMLSVTGSDVAIAAARAGHGLARPISYQVEEDVLAGRLRLLLQDYEPPPLPVQLVYPEGRRAAAKVRAFVDFAAARLRDSPGLAADRRQ
jgi:DNA-binding transcriptional LysR family regulator